MLSFLPCISTHLKCPQVTYVKHNRIVGNGVYIVFRREHVFESPPVRLLVLANQGTSGWCRVGGGVGEGWRHFFLQFYNLKNWGGWRGGGGGGGLKHSQPPGSMHGPSKLKCFSFDEQRRGPIRRLDHCDQFQTRRPLYTTSMHTKVLPSDILGKLGVFTCCTATLWLASYFILKITYT